MTVLFGLIGSAAKLSKSFESPRRLPAAIPLSFAARPNFWSCLLVYFGSAVTLTGDRPGLRSRDVSSPISRRSGPARFAIALVVGSYATETFRGAFLGVDHGQIEAARALGLSGLQTFVYVRIPANVAARPAATSATTCCRSSRTRP